MKFLFVVILACSSLNGQETPTTLFRHYGVEDGLSQGSINGIVRDHKGFLWIATHDGLNRFDGIEFRVFRNIPGDSRSLGENWIVGLVLDSAGTLWVRASKGVYRLDRARESFARVPTLSETILLALADSAEKPCLLMGGNPAALYNPATEETTPFIIRKQDGTWAPLVTTVATIDGAGFLWAVQDSFLLRIDLATYAVESSIKLVHQHIHHLAPDPVDEETVWGASFTTVLKCSRDSLTAHPFSGGRVLLADSAGTLWVGTNEGLVHLKFSNGRSGPVSAVRLDLSRGNASGNNTITSLRRDASGILWVGTYNGLYLHHRSAPRFTIYRSAPDQRRGLANSFVIPMAEDPAGNIWFGTFGSGVSVLQKRSRSPGAFYHLHHEPENANSLRSDNVRSMVTAKNGNIWIGSTRGLNVYDARKKTIVSVHPLAGIGSFGVEAMCESGQGGVWISNQGTVLRMSGDPPFEAVSRIPVSRDTPFNTLLEDLSGNLWLGTDGAGLIDIDPETRAIRQFINDEADSSSVSNNNVWTIMPDTYDPENVFWIGTSRGLNKFDSRTGRFTRFLEQEGFPNSCVYAILTDEMHRLWLSTNKGLVVFDRHGPEGRRFRNYTSADGIAGNEFNRRSALRLRSGEFLFGGPNGVTRFHPAKMNEDPASPPLVVTGFYRLGERMLFDRDIADVSEIELRHDEAAFTFEFAALNLVNPSRTQYAYRMEGIDPDWVQAGSRRSVNYAFVSPGEYVFRVKSSHISGLWNPDEIAVRLRVHPPFWATWWFLTFAFSIVVAGIVAFARWRLHKLLEMERLRSRIARDLHDEIGSNLSSIAMASDLLGRQPGLGERERGKLSQISSVALSTVKEMKDMVWLINPQNDALDDLLLRMKDTASAMLDGRQCMLNFPDAPEDRKVSLDWKRNVYLIFKESLANVAKHSNATEVTIDVAVVKDVFRLKVKDNGLGFDPDGANGGHGLKNMWERSTMLNAAFDVAGERGKGTTLTLEARIT